MCTGRVYSASIVGFDIVIVRIKAHFRAKSYWATPTRIILTLSCAGEGDPDAEGRAGGQSGGEAVGDDVVEVA